MVGLTWVAAPAQASKIGLALPGELAAGMLLGTGLAGATLVSYAATDVPLDGIFVPPAIAWVQLGVSAAAYVGGGLWLEHGSGSGVALTMPFTLLYWGGLLGVHAVLSLLAYDAPPPRDLALGFALSPMEGGLAAQVRLRL